jgi:hypothetical protein
MLNYSVTTSIISFTPPYLLQQASLSTIPIIKVTLQLFISASTPSINKQFFSFISLFFSFLFTKIMKYPKIYNRSEDCLIMSAKGSNGDGSHSTFCINVEVEKFQNRFTDLTPFTYEFTMSRNNSRKR